MMTVVLVRFVTKWDGLWRLNGPVWTVIESKERGRFCFKAISVRVKTNALLD